MTIVRMLFAALVAAALLAGTHTAGAQTVQAPDLSAPRVPRVSQGAVAKQIVGLSEITITYHRPGVKGRAIWGGLLPYNQVWRAGANEPTLITMSDPVTVAGKKLNAGTYRLLVIPTQGDWTLIFNSETKNWGTVYDSTFDVVKIAVKPESGAHEEFMSFSFTDLTSSSAKVVLAWEKMRLAFTLEFNTMGKMETAVGDWRLLNAAARFAMTEKGAEAKALEWVERSIALDKNGGNVRTKAEIMAAQGKFADAVKLGEESIALTKAQNPNANVSALEQLIATWSKAR